MCIMFDSQLVLFWMSFNVFGISSVCTLFVRCHVMEVESFEDEAVAKLLNDWFVSIKVI